MKSLMTFIGILAFNFSSFSQASEFACPVAPAFSNHTCAGTVRVQNMEQLNTYKNSLGVVASKPTVAKGLLIDFNPVLSADLSIATPCMIKTAPNITITSTGNVCLNGKRKLLLDEGFHFSGKNLNLESSEDVVVNKNSVITAQDIKLISKGSEEINQAFFREGAQITAGNILIESSNKGFVGRNSNLKLTGTLAIHTLGDEEASIRQGTIVDAKKIDVNSTGVTRIANLTTLTASEITLIGAQGCEISKGSVMTTADRIGNCFLTSLTKESFSIDKNRGTNPLTVTFNASTIAEAKGFIWDFGDGKTLSTLTPTTTHTYSTVGSFVASLKYATKENYKALKVAGSVQIDVKPAPVVPTTPPRGYFTFAQDGTFIYLKSFIRRTQFDIASAYYVIDDNQNNKIYMSNFYQNTQSNVEMNTYGSHKVTMYVEDTQGQKYNTTLNIWLHENPDNIEPVVRFYGEQSAIRTVFINMYQSFTPGLDENLKEFTVDFGDGQIEQVENAASVTHTYAQAGVYNVTVSAQNHGNIRSLTQSITVTDVNKPILNPIAGFYYYILDYAGNVVLTDDRSATPNGEIISYEWNFGNGIVTHGQQASHFFAPGDHLVTLTVTDVAGLRSSQTQKIHIEEVGENFVAAFDYTDVSDKKLELGFVALDNENQISRVKIDWGDGTTKIYTEAEVSAWGYYEDEHEYQNYGTYNVKLTVDTLRGQTKFATYQAAIKASPPVADLFCYTSNLLVRCNALGSYDPTGSPLTFSFDYGDSFTETNVNGISSHAYSSAGLFTVKLRVTNERGDQVTTQTQVQPLLPPNRMPNPVLLCYSNTPYLLRCTSNGSVDQDGTIVSHKLEWDDGTSDVNADGRELFHIFTEGGSHQVTLTVTDNDGGVSSVTQDFVVQINQPPVAAFYCNELSAQRVYCHSQSLDPDRNDLIVEYKWDLGNGESVITTIPYLDYTYSSSSTYQITLQVKDSFGSTSTVSKSITTKENQPPFVFGFCSSFGPQNLNCFANAYDTDSAGPVLIEWLIEGNVINDSNVNITLSSSGLKTIRLRVTDFNGASVIKEFPVTVLENKSPIANASCAFTGDKTILCKSSSFDTDGNINQTKWTIGEKVVLGTSFVSEINEGETLNYSLEVKDNLGKISIYVGIVDPKLNALETISSIENNCPVADALKEKDCSNSYFTANTISELQDYLSNGKLDAEGKLLNLELKNIKFEGRALVSTSCQLKISRGSQIQSGKEGICLHGSSIFLDSNSIISASGKGAINLLSENSITLNQSSLNTEGDVNFLTTNFIPFDGGVKFINSTTVESSSLRIDTRSNIIQDATSDFLTEAMILNGGNCQIIENQFLGTCNNDPFADNLSLSVEASDVSSSDQLDISIDGLVEGSYLYSWRMDENSEYSSENGSFSTKFSFPGKHLAEAAVMDSNGKFKIVSREVNSYINKYKHNEVALIYLKGSKTFPDQLAGSLNSQVVMLKKTSFDSELYAVEIKLENATQATLSVPDFQFHMNFEIESLPEITDPVAYIEQVLVNDGIDVNLPENAGLLELKNSMLQYSPEDQLRFAKIIQANLYSTETIIVNLMNKKMFGDLFLNDAHAEDDFNVDVETSRAMLQYTTAVELRLFRTVARYSAAVSIIGLGIFSAEPLVIGAGMLLFVKVHTEAKNFFNDLAKYLNFLSEMVRRIGFEPLLGSAKSAEVFPGKLSSEFTKAEKNVKNSALVKNAINQNKNVNSVVEKVNTMVNYFNGGWNIFTSKKAEKINLQKIPDRSFRGALSPEFITEVKILSPNSGKVKVLNFSNDGSQLNIVFEAEETTTAKVELTYKNNVLGITEKVNFDVVVKAASSPNVEISSINAVRGDFTNTFNVDGFAGAGRTIQVLAKDLSTEYDSSQTTFKWKLIRNYPFGSKPLKGPVVFQNGVYGNNYILNLPYRDISYEIVLEATNMYGKVSTSTYTFFVKSNNPPIISVGAVSCPLSQEGYSNGVANITSFLSDDQYLIDGNSLQYTVSKVDVLRASDGITTSTLDFLSPCPVIKQVYHWKTSVVCQKGDLNVCYGSCPEGKDHSIVNTGLQSTYIKIYNERDIFRSQIYLGEANNALGSKFATFTDPNDHTKEISIDIGSSCSRGGNGPQVFEF